MPIVDPWKGTKPDIVDPLKAKVPTISQGDPISMWDSAMSMFDDPAKEGAKAVKAIVDSEALGISPHAAWKYRDEIDRGVKINPTAAGLTSTLWERVKQSFSTGLTQNQLSELGKSYVLTGDQSFLESINNVSIPTEAETFIEESRLEGAVRKAAQVLPMTILTAMEGTTEGMGIGMVAGTVAMLYGPQSVVTVPAATALGFTAGSTAAFYEASARKSAGLAVIPILAFEDEYGNKMDPNIARAAAFGYGAISGLVEVAQFKLLLKTIPGMSNLFSSAITKAVTSEGVKAKLLALSGQYVGTVAGETAQEVAQDSVNIVFEETAKIINNMVKGTDIKRTDANKVINRLLETMDESAQAFAVMALPGISAKAAGVGIRKLPGLKGGDKKIKGSTGQVVKTSHAKTQTQEDVAGVPEAMIIGVEENEDGDPVSYTMADTETGHTFDVEVGASAEEIKSKMAIGRKKAPVEETIDRLIKEPENEAAILDEIVADAPATRFEEFSGQVSAIVPPDQAKAVTTLLEARATAVGMNPDEYIQYHGLEVSKDTTANAGVSGETKADVTFTETKTIIRAFESSDVSSMVHELGHVFRRDIGGKDLKVAEEWAGVKDGKWTVDSEEKFSRGFERYLKEGKAPSPELKRVFEQFKEWLTEIYQAIKGSSLDVDISPEMSKVFDGLLAVKEDTSNVTELSQSKETIKTRVRRTTGQVDISPRTVSEKEGLRESLRRSAQAARKAMSEGKKEGVVKEKTRMTVLLANEKARGKARLGKVLTEKQNIQRRRETIKGFRDYFGLTDADLKKLSRKDIRLMDDAEFSKFKDDMYLSAVELTETKQKKIEVLTTIRELKLQKTENYRKALELPTLDKMTLEELDQFNEAMLPFQEGDVFLTQRELETVDRTDLKGIKTWREARDRLAKESGVSIEELEKVKVENLDNFRWDTALMDRNPFYNVLVSGVTKYMLSSQLEAHNVETKVYELARKAEKSRSRTLLEKAIPQNKLIIEYLETPDWGREAIASKMTPEEIDYAHYMQEYFSQSLEYLISTKSLDRGRTNYFVHMRRTFLEDIKEDGLLDAVKNIFKNYEQDEVGFNILDDDTGNILPLEKFFQFSMRRTGVLVPSANVTKSFMTYVATMEKKKALDAIIPKMDIYAQSLTPQRYTKRGLEIDRSLKKFVNKWINNKKGRKISYDSVIKQGGPIDLGINALRTFTTLLDLGLSVPIRLATFVGEQVSTVEMLGAKQYALGTKRIGTKKGRKISKKYEAFTGRSAWEEFTAPGVELPQRFMTGLFGMFHAATVVANKQFLLGSITKDEYNSGKITTERLASLRLEMGRFRMVPGTSSLIGSTSLGKAATQYKSWAVPIMRTTVQDVRKVITDLNSKPPGEALTTRESREIYRLIGITSTVLIVGAMSGSEDVDESFIGKLKSKMYREALTLMQGLDPALWLSTPRTMVWLAKLGKSIESLLLLEEYETKPGLKGVEGLKKQFIPRQLRSKDE